MRNILQSAYSTVYQLLILAAKFLSPDCSSACDDSETLHSAYSTEYQLLISLYQSLALHNHACCRCTSRVRPQLVFKAQYLAITVAVVVLVQAKSAAYLRMPYWHV